MTVSYVIPLSVLQQLQDSEPASGNSSPEQPTEINFGFSEGNPRCPEAATDFVIITIPRKCFSATLRD